MPADDVYDLGTLRRLAKMHKIAVTDPVSKNYWSKAALAVRLVTHGVSVCPRAVVGVGSGVGPGFTAGVDQNSMNSLMPMQMQHMHNTHNMNVAVSPYASSVVTTPVGEKHRNKASAALRHAQRLSALEKARAAKARKASF